MVRVLVLGSRMFGGGSRHAARAIPRDGSSQAGARRRRARPARAFAACGRDGCELLVEGTDHEADVRGARLQSACDGATPAFERTCGRVSVGVGATIEFAI